MEGNRKYVFLENGVVIASAAYFSNMALSICNQSLFSNLQLGLIAGGSLVGGAALDWFFREGNYEKLFRNCGIQNKDMQVPIVIKNDKKNNTLVLHMPEGISQKKFEEKQQELEQALNCKIEFGFNKNLTMKMTDIDLNTNYPYVFEECDSPLKIFIGYINGGKFYFDISKAPHTIIAGETGTGKSSILYVIATSLIQSKYDIHLYLHDFQSCGIGVYQKCKKVKWYGETVEEFERLLNHLETINEERRRLFNSVSNKVYVDKLSVWNSHFPDRYLPPIVVLVDEFAMLSDDEYKPVLSKFKARAAMDRKVGIHYAISMQRPDVRCIEGAIKANFPCRIAGKTVTETDSKVILDTEGAEKLKNSGRFLIKYCGKLEEAQSMLIEAEDVMKYLKKNKLYKSQEEIELEKQIARKKQIDDFHKKFNSPYGGNKNDN